MNIGIFTETYDPQINGVTTSICTLEKELTRRGHTVYIFTTTDPMAKHPMPRVFRLPSMPFVFFPSRRIAFLYSPKLLSKLKKFKLDIIHTQTEFPLGFFGKIVSEFYKLPLVHTYHTMYEDYVHYIANGHLVTPKIAQKYSKFFCNRADIVISPSSKTKESLLKYGVKKPIVIIPTGVDFSMFERDKYSIQDINNAKLELGLNLNDPIIVTITRISREKSLDVLIKSMPSILLKLPNVKLVIIGDGPMLPELKQLMQDLNLTKSIIFPGFKPWSEIAKFYMIGDVFASASTSETQGLTYIEAMASKVPIIVKKDKNLDNTIIDGFNGYYFDEDSCFSDVAIKVISNLNKTKIVVENAYDSIKNYSISQFGTNVENLYSDMISKSKSKPNLIKKLLKI